MPQYNSTPYNTPGSPYMLPPDPGVDARRSNVAGWIRKFLDTIRGDTDMTSPSFPPSVNFGLGAANKVAQGATMNPKLIGTMQPPGVVKSAFDWLFTPEATQDAQVAATAPVGTPSINLNKLRTPPTPGDKPITMFELPQPDLPTPPTDNPFIQGKPPMVSPFEQSAPPQQSPFEQPLPPTPAQMPMPSDQIAPDYSEFNSWMEKATPQPSDVDWDKQKRLEGFAGLAKGAADWRPGSGWGSLIAGGASGVAQGVLDNRKNELNADDAYTKAMQEFASQRAKISMGMAGDEANRKNTDQTNQLNWEREGVDQANRYDSDKFNVESGNLERKNTTKNANERTVFDVREGNAERRAAATETNTARTYEVDQKNLQSIHESNVTNGQNRYKLAVEKAQREAPQVESITKDGAVIITTKGGKRVLQYQPFKTGGGSEQLAAAEKRFGKDSGTYKMMKAKDMLENGDDISLMKSMVEDSVSTGYAKGIFGEAFEAAQEEVEKSLMTQPGSKEYPAEFAKMMTAALLKHMNLADPELMKAFAANGNIEARYLLSGEEDNIGDQGR